MTDPGRIGASAGASARAELREKLTAAGHSTAPITRGGRERVLRAAVAAAESPGSRSADPSPAAAATATLAAPLVPADELDPAANHPWTAEQLRDRANAERGLLVEVPYLLGWRPAGPGDQPGQLIPGEDDPAAVPPQQAADDPQRRDVAAPAGPVCGGCGTLLDLDGSCFVCRPVVGRQAA